MLRKLGQNYQVAIPKQIAALLHLNINDYLEISAQGNKIIIEPQVLIPKSQAYFYAEDWQKDENEASKNIKLGEITKTKNINDLLKKLDE